MKYRHAKYRAEVLKAVANPVRIMILDALQKGDACVSDLNKMVTINQSNFSRHLTVLKKAGIITDRRVGMKVYYHLVTPCILDAFDCAVKVIESDNERRLALTRKR